MVRPVTNPNLTEIACKSVKQYYLHPNDFREMDIYPFENDIVPVEKDVSERVFRNTTAVQKLNAFIPSKEAVAMHLEKKNENIQVSTQLSVCM